jgi:hypothetical protein
MSAPDDNRPLAHGLQEWAVCCRALGEGRITLTVRKGGIHERGGGLFALEQQRFALMPTYLHQEATRVLPAYAGTYFGAVAADPEPGVITIAWWAEAARIWKVDDLARVQALGSELLWHGDELARRFAYRDQPWLYVVALRIHRLAQPVAMPDHPSYAGCRSWIPLKQPIPTVGSTAVLNDTTHARRLAAIDGLLGG